MNTRLLMIVAASVEICFHAAAQQPAYPHVGAASSRLSGPIVLSHHYSEPIGSLDTLIMMSEVIVDGTVLSTLPSIVSNPDTIGQVETDAIVGVRQVIRGQLPEAQFVLTEGGGTQGRWQVSYQGDPFVKQGERYIFFLRRDRRKDVKNGAGILPGDTVAKRYGAVNSPNGKARVQDNGDVQFLPAAVTVLHDYDAPSVSVFLDSLRKRIAVVYPPLPPLPGGPPIDGPLPPIVAHPVNVKKNQ